MMKKLFLLFVIVGLVVVFVLYSDRKNTNAHLSYIQNGMEKKITWNSLHSNPVNPIPTRPALSRIENTKRPDVKQVTTNNLNNTSSRIASSAILKKSQTQSKEQWSKKWPRVNMKNCSHREYMNRGINSPRVIKNLPYLQTGLISFPGSGNTWTRYLIEQATGLWTGSVYRDGALYKGGLEGEMEDPKLNSTVAVKDHGSKMRYDRVIYIVRDPYRALLSEFNRRSSKSHTKGANQRQFESKNWESYVMLSGQKWSKSQSGFINTYMNKSKLMGSEENPFTKDPGYWKSLLLVSYERLLKNSQAELERIVKFLGLSVFRKHCLQENTKGNFRRPPRSDEHVACLYENPKILKKMEESKQSLREKAKTIGAGNVLAEIKTTVINEIKTINCTKERQNSG